MRVFRSLCWGSLLLLSLTTVLPATPVSSLICSNPGSTSATAGDTTINANSCTHFSYAYPSAHNVQAVTGANNWLYGYYQGTLGPSSFQTMTPVRVDAQGHPSANGTFVGWYAVDYARYWTSLDAFGGHPNSPNTDLHDEPFCVAGQNCGSGHDTKAVNSAYHVEQDAVRRYVVPSGVNGTADITYSLQKDYRTAFPEGDGTLGSIVLVHNGVSVTLASIDVPLPLLNHAATAADMPLESSTINGVRIQAGDFLDFVLSPKSTDYGDGTFTLSTIRSVSQVPEPGSTTLIGLGMFAIGLLQFRKTRPRS